MALFNVDGLKHKGLLTGLYLDPATAAALALPGYEPPEQLHVTLCYCGKVTDLGDPAIARAVLATERVAGFTQPFSVQITHIERFPATESSDWLDVVVARVTSPELLAMRAWLAKELESVGCPPNTNFTYKPHITLAYIEPTDPMPTVAAWSEPIRFSHVTLRAGHQFTHLPMGERPVTLSREWHAAAISLGNPSHGEGGRFSTPEGALSPGQVKEALGSRKVEMERDRFDQLMSEGWTTKRATLAQASPAGNPRHPLVRVVKLWKDNKEPRVFIQPGLTYEQAIKGLDLSVVNLPDIADVSFPAMVGAIQPTKPNKRRRRVKYQGVMLSRKPTDFEARVLSLTAIPDRFTQEIDRTVEELRELRIGQLSLSALKEDQDTAADGVHAILLDAVARMARYGAMEVRQECRRQGMTMSLVGDEDEALEWVNTAMHRDTLMHRSVTLRADTVARQWQDELHRSAVRLARVKKVAAFIDHVTPKAVYGLKTEVRKLLHEGFGFGRRTQMRNLLAPSKVLDLGNPHKGEGGRFSSADDAVFAGTGPPFRATDINTRGWTVLPEASALDLERHSHGASNDPLYQKIQDGARTSYMVTNTQGTLFVDNAMVGRAPGTDDEFAPGRFLYVKFVSVSTSGKGFGQNLYRRAFAMAKKEGYDGIASEEDGRNPGSERLWKSVKDKHKVVTIKGPSSPVDYLVKLSDVPDADETFDLAKKRDDDDEVEVDYVVQTAILDQNVCDHCEAMDGQTFEFGSEEQEEAEPPFYLCDGGDNCRCIQLFVVRNWRERDQIDEEFVVTQKQAEKIIERRR